MAGSSIEALFTSVPDDLLDEEASSQVVEEAAPVVKAEPLSEADAEAQLGQDISDALDYMDATFSSFWAEAQAYYDGGTNLPTIEGRSQVVHTAVANAVRGAKPSVMRVLLQSGAINRYVPTASVGAEIAEQQTLYVNQLFWRCNGYRVLSDLVQDAMLKRMGVLMWYYSEDKTPEYHRLSGVPAEVVQKLLNDKNIVVLGYSAVSETVMDPTTGMPIPVELYDLEVSVPRTHGCIKLEYVPLSEFFIDQNAKSSTENTVIGRARDITVGELKARGFTDEELEDLDENDREAHQAPSKDATLRRKNSKKTLLDDLDKNSRKVFICEVYRTFDMDGTGIPQLYKFTTGGTQYKVLRRERVSDIQLEVINAEHVPGTVVGRSFHDILKQDQDTTTSVLRGTVDNLHHANNRRLAVHDQLVNLGDVMSAKIGAPIRVKAPGQIQEIGVQPMVGVALPLLQYLITESQTKVGVTAAALGLDPDALQSTDKEAVQNTIQLSQGQIELIVRNIAEGLKRVFHGILKLSMQYLDRKQMISLTGMDVEVDQSNFSLALTLEPKVGLGTDDHMMRVQTLQMILARQEQIMQAMGPANPFVDLSHISNTQQDLLRELRIYNPERYFRVVDAPTGAKISQDMQKAAAEAAARTIDPNVAFLQSKQIDAEKEIKTKTIDALSEQRKAANENRLKAIELAMTDDLERDKLAQKREMDSQAILGKYKTAVDTKKIVAEQKAPRSSPASGEAE